MRRVTQAEPIRRRSALRAGAGLTAALAAGCAPAEQTDTATSAPAPKAHRTAPATRAAPGPRRFPGQPAQIAHGPRSTDQVALTFHGQGDPDVAHALLKQAERARARITVLAVGTWLDKHPDLARRIIDGGHDLGNHTMRHIGISELPEDEARAEITDCADRIRRLTGSIGTWFRPSRNRTATPLVARLARGAGYPHVLSYDVDSLDYTSPGQEAVVQNVVSAVRPGSIVSLHFGYADTVKALPTLLDHLDRRGLSAVTCTELLS
ncbi:MULTISPECIES: polysaccharide deacetylase family protein [unclassified Streptomyces]|uniref:polysaccharide deacetylase family protein n=1 Tax=unclassified Streptomyces TaxID=2593676 RepID=UPI000DBA983D|nr:polysaccharide deacetylase family protein [Streptomyces sp. PsTaAH-137]MYT69536.1 polysaccharide deacetylase family protein [Streptomyces sp. SID8367]